MHRVQSSVQLCTHCRILQNFTDRVQGPVKLQAQSACLSILLQRLPDTVQLYVETAGFINAICTKCRVQYSCSCTHFPWSQPRFTLGCGQSRFRPRLQRHVCRFRTNQDGVIAGNSGRFDMSNRSSVNQGLRSFHHAHASFFLVLDWVFFNCLLTVYCIQYIYGGKAALLGRITYLLRDPALLGLGCARVPPATRCDWTPWEPISGSGRCNVHRDPPIFWDIGRTAVCPCKQGRLLFCEKGRQLTL